MLPLSQSVPLRGSPPRAQPPLTPRNTNSYTGYGASTTPAASANRRATLPAGWEAPSAAVRAGWETDSAVKPSMPRLPSWDIGASPAAVAAQPAYVAAPPASSASVQRRQTYGDSEMTSPRALYAPPAAPVAAAAFNPWDAVGAAPAPPAQPTPVAAPTMAPAVAPATAPATAPGAYVPPWASQLAYATTPAQPAQPAPVAEHQPAQQPQALYQPAPPQHQQGGYPGQYAPVAVGALSPPTMSATPAVGASRISTRRTLGFDAAPTAQRVSGAGAMGGAGAYSRLAAALPYDGGAPVAAATGLLDARPGDERLLMVSYEACVQACLEAALQQGSQAGDPVGAARTFVADRCVVLQKAFGLQPLLLQPGGAASRAHNAPRSPRGAEVRAVAAAAAAAAAAEPTTVTCVTRSVTVELQKLSWSRGAGAALLPKALRRAIVGQEQQHAERLAEQLSVRLDAARPEAARRVSLGCAADLSVTRQLSASGGDVAAAFGGCGLVLEGTSREGRPVVGRLSLEGARGRTTQVAQLKTPAGEVLATAEVSTLVEDTTSLKAVQPSAAAAQAAAAAAAAGVAARQRGRLVADEGEEWRAAVQENAVYDAALEAALRATGFGKRRLGIRADWAWLLARLCAQHCVSDSYAALRHLLHVFAGSATPTADCLDLVLQLFHPVHCQGEDGALGPAEARMWAAAREGCDRLVASVFENYKSLVETLPSGLVDGGVLPFGAPCPAAALPLAVRLFTLLHDPLGQDFALRLQAHFRAAAGKCYWRHAAGALENTGAGCATGESLDGGGGAPSLPFQDSYSSLARLCASLGEELRMDIQVHDAEVLPQSFYLPALTAEEYTRELGDKLKTFLASCPPPRPAGTILDLLDAVGDLQDRLQGWQLAGPSTAPVEPVALFGRYIRAWIADSRAMLVARCRAWAVASTRTGPEGAASVAELYGAMQGVLSEYERVVARWPLFAAELEDALAAAERTMLSAVEGWVAPVLPPNFRFKAAPPASPLKVSPEPPKPVQRKPSRAGAWICGAPKDEPATPPKAAPSPARPHRTVSNGSAMLGGLPSCLAAALVALKAMEALRSDCHARLKRWATGGGGAAAESFGTLFLVVGQELRGKYMDYLQLAVAKVADGLKRQGVSLRGTLKQLMPGTDVEALLGPTLAATRDTVAGLERACGRGRAFVGVTRGLWDAQAQAVMQFLVEDCKENSSWAQRAAASAALEQLATLYASLLSGEGGALGHDVREEDLRPPEHARRVADLQNLSLNTSFSMY